MLKVFVFLSLLLGLMVPLSGQDAIFSQFYAAPLQLNPALAGVSIAPRVGANYRSQYGSYPNAYQTYAVSYEQPFEGKPSSIGLSLMNNIQADGAYRVTSFSAIYSYEVQMSENLYARLGISIGALQTRVDFSQLVFGDVLDPIEGNTGGTTAEELVASSKTSFNSGAGIVLYSGPLFGGFSLDHLNRPDEGLIEINDNLYAGRPLRVNVHFGGQIKLKRYSNRRRPAYVTPNLLYSRQAAFQQLNVGAYFGYGNFFLGGWYRHAFENADAAIAVVGVREGVFRLSYSYDATLSALRSVPGGLGGTHEIGLSLNFGDSAELQRKRFKSRFNDCFGMFN